MSGLKPLEVEQRLYAITERMTQVRFDMQTGRMDTRVAQDTLDTLKKEYYTTKHESESLEPDYSEPDYTDYVEEENNE